MSGSTPTNHAAYVTIDGVKYSLCNYYGPSNNPKASSIYANVIKKVGSTSASTTTKTTYALKSISLNKNTMSLTAGSTGSLSVSYNPANTTDSKSITWSTSNSSVATVSGGKVTAKKAGTATITAKVGSKTATCKVTVSAKSVALSSISLNKTSMSLTAGNTGSLTVSYYPSNTTDSKNVTWSTSNNSVATVSGGKVTAKKAGTATITAKVGSKTATCKVTVKAKKVTAESGSYKDASNAYTQLNKFRTTKKVWQWNKDNKSKTYFNTKKSNTLKSLKRDSALEKTAKLRAKEAAQMYYKGKSGMDLHTRPNGKSCFTAFPSGLIYRGENLAYGSKSMLDAKYVTVLWQENNYKYSGQGHRRNMLDKNFTHVGIACYEVNGMRFWAQCFAKK